MFIPISPLEEHGPHLPIGTDLLTSGDAARQAIMSLYQSKHDISALLYPRIPLGYTKMADCFAGTVSSKPSVVKSVVCDVISSFARYGVKFFVVCTFHMDLGHLKGIYAAKNKMMRSYDVKIVEPWGPYFFGKTVEQREPKVGFDTKKEVHACFRETSLMKYQYPYLVDKNYTQLQNIYRDLYSARYVGKTFKDIGIAKGYVGSPARADSDYGRWYFQQIVDCYVSAAVDMVDGKDAEPLPKHIQRMMKSLFWL